VKVNSRYMRLILCLVPSDCSDFSAMLNNLEVRHVSAVRHFTTLHNHTDRHTTVCRTPLDQ
jgi:hypothetical protein